MRCADKVRELVTRKCEPTRLPRHAPPGKLIILKWLEMEHIFAPNGVYCLFYSLYQRR